MSFAPDDRSPAPGTPATPRRKALAVVGMHRSGTSAAARVMSLLGADLPANLMPPVANDNPRGFWEPERVARLHDEILAALGSSWDDVFPLPKHWHRAPALRPRAAEMLALLAEEFGDSEFFVLKDPRVSLMVPMWLETLARFGAAPYFVIMLRNPLEVAASLQARNDFPPSKSLAIWLRYMLDAELFTRGSPRTVVCYRDLLRDGPAIARKIGTELAIDFPRDHYLARLEIEQFLSRADRHHAISDEELDSSSAPTWVKRAYAALRRMAAGADDDAQAALDAVRAESSVAEEAYGVICADWRLKLRQARDQLEQAEKKRAEAECAVEGLRAQGESEELESRRAQEQAQRDIAARQAYEQLQRTAAEAQDALVAATRANGEKRAEIEQLRHDAAAWNDERSQLREQLAANAEEIAGLKREMTELRRSGEILGQAIIEARAALERSRSEADAARSETRACEERLAARAREALRLQQELEARRAELVAERERTSVLERELAKTEAMLSDWEGSAMAARDGERALAEALLRRNPAEAAGGIRRWAGKVARETLDWARSVHRRRRIRQRQRLLASGLFDAAYYLARNADVVVNGMDPLDHFLACGASEGRRPCALFDTAWYMAIYQDTVCSRINPLDHYVQYGAAEGRKPNPLFDTVYYLQENPGVALSGQNPLAHYLQCGAEQGRRPHPLFDGAYYLRRYPDVRLLGLNPLAHYLEHGAAQGRWPNPLFDGEYYLRQNPVLAASRINPLQHYLDAGAREGCNPNAYFDNAYYLAENPEVVGAGLNPLTHYLEVGAAAGRCPGPRFNPAAYLAENPAAAASGQNPLAHFLEHGLRDGPRSTDLTQDPLPEPVILQTVVPTSDRWSTVRQFVDGIMPTGGTVEPQRRSKNA